MGGSTLAATIRPKESLVISTVESRNGKVIRLTDERWVHIIEEHAELAGMRLEVLEAVAGLGVFLRVGKVNCSRSESLRLASR